jgi:UDP-N-acetyl-D-glucosamine dehydrogenase
VVERTAEALNTVKKAVNGARIHIVGVAYKRDVDDMRESPALDVIELLKRRGATVTYTDPFVPVLRHGPVDLTSVSLDQALAAGADCAVIVTDHSTFDYPAIARRFPLVVDTRNALKGLRTPTVFAL